MSEVLKRKTSRLRYSIVFTVAKTLTPSLYRDFFLNYSRGMVNFILERKTGKPLVGVEVGVAGGTHAYRMLTLLDLKELYLVDPYLPYIDGDGVTWNTGERDFLTAKKDLKQFKQIEFIKQSSVEAAKLLPDELDFVYIDANHNYESVKADIAAYYPKVKLGGVIGGHDFHSKYQGVIFAVTEFARSFNEKLYFDGLDWWINKKLAE